MERKNKVTKACASHNSNPGNKYEASVLGRLLVEQASHLQQVRHQGLDCPVADPGLAAALQVATCFVSRVMTEGVEEALPGHACLQLWPGILGPGLPAGGWCVSSPLPTLGTTALIE